MVNDHLVDELLLKAYDKGLDHDEFRLIKSLSKNNLIQIDYFKFLNSNVLTNLNRINKTEIDLKLRRKCTLYFDHKDLSNENLDNLLDELESFPTTRLIKLSDSIFNSLLNENKEYIVSITLKIQGKFKEYSLIHIVKLLRIYLKNGVELSKLRELNFLCEVDFFRNMGDNHD